MLLSFLRTVILYFSLILVVRLMGKRQVGGMEPSELVVAMLIADLAAIPMQDTGITLFSGLVPIFTVLAAEIILSALSFRFTGIQKLLCGKPVILMENGKMLYANLKKTRVSVHELTEFLRENGILEPQTVKYAILETDGKISVLPFPKYQPAAACDAGVQVTDAKMPIAVIVNGTWQKDNLSLLNLSRSQILEQLKHRNCSVEQVLLLTVVNGKIRYLARKDEG